MTMDGWVPPPDERLLGIDFYATRAPGVGGRLKRDSDDFRVEELSAYPLPVENGPVTVLRVRSHDWEQHELTGRLAEQLGILPQAIRWAGTKDRRAVAERIMSYRGAPPPPGQLTIPRVEVLETYRARDELVLGHHYGNRFRIWVREFGEPLETVVARAHVVRDELQATAGFPNFFGAQRFGEVRPITHAVGRALVQGEVDRAVDLYLCEVPPGEVPLGEAARREYSRHRDPARALREFPPTFQFERALLDHLARGHSPARALRALGRPLRTLFIHAYQAHIFNRYLSRRRMLGLSMVDPVPGDSVLRTARDGTHPGRDPVPVDDDNLAEVRKLVSDGKARLVGPLVGYSTPTSGGPAGELLESILSHDKVTRDQFRLPSTPDIASAGNWRPLWVPPPSVGLSGGGSGGEAHLALTFNLPRGTYATVLLREFMKVGARAPESS